MSVQIGYWADHVKHPYFRQKVDLVENFCGWDALKELLSYASPWRDQPFIACLFQTGGRVSETLALRKNNFILKESDKVLLVENMMLLKRYKKLKEPIDGKTTERIVSFRKKFPISLTEPLTPIIQNWIQELRNKEGKETNFLLFKSSYKLGEPLSRHWAYWTIRKLDSEISDTLRETLGLNKPLLDKHGNEVKDKLHLWLHFFRSQRASALVDLYGFSVLDLIDFFSWKRADTAVTYARRGWKGLADKMR